MRYVKSQPRVAWERGTTRRSHEDATHDRATAAPQLSSYQAVLGGLEGRAGGTGPSTIQHEEEL